MTYQELLLQLQSMSPEELCQDATVYLSETDEYVAIDGTGYTSEECDVLDPGHFILSIPF